MCLTDSHSSRPDWADDEEFDDATTLPPQQISTNKDGTKTVISFRLNDDGKRVRTTRRIRTTVIKETVNPRVAERRAWAKFGLEDKKPAGPSFDTTSVGENIVFRPSVTWKKDGKEETKGEDKDSTKKQLEGKKVKCRICDGEHFTARCPFKDTMAPMGEDGVGDGAGGGAGGADEGVSKEGGLGVGGSSYVPPHLRKGGAGTGERMGGKYERDDLATLRVTNVSLPFGVHVWSDSNMLTRTGLRVRRGAGSTRDIREIWASDAGLSCQRSRNGAGEGFCVYQFPGAIGCCESLRQDRWL